MTSLSPLPRSYAQIRALLSALPDGPGVYQFRDRGGRLLYVGKSISLRRRVRSYFGAAAGRSRKLRRLRSRAGAIEWMETGSELEALLLESRRIKESHPPFNTLLHRHRHLVFLRLDRDDPYPRLEVTEALRRDGARYFGPWVLTADAERLAAILSDTLRLRTCDPPGDRLHRIAPCLRRDMGLCHAPCVRPADTETYAAAIEEIERAFESEGRPFRERLREEMLEAAERLLFERAARLRDALQSLDELAGRQQAVMSAVAALDVVAACPSRRPDSVEIFLFCSGYFAAQLTVRRDALRQPETALETARGLLARRAASESAMRELEVEPDMLDQLFLIGRWLRRNSGEGRHFVLPEGEETNFLALRLGAWLGRADAAIPGPAGAAGDPLEAQAEWLAEWADG